LATIFTHAALPLLAGRPRDRRFLIAAVLCACLPDLDFLAYVFDVRPPSMWGHRGLTHSLPFAAVLAAVIAALAYPSLLKTPKAWARIWLGLFGWGAAHGLADALTFGDVGVALLAPLSEARLHFPIHPIPVVPLGFDEALGRWGALVLLNELLLIVVPVALLSRWLAAGRDVRRLGAITAGWLAVVIALKVAAPDQLAPRQTRELKSFGLPGLDEDPSRIPRDGLPGDRLVTRIDELKALGLFDAELRPAVTPWSSTFFPSWYGGVAGRWQESRLTLIGRTLTGVTPLTPEQAKQALESGATKGLAPLEKLDLALEDFGLKATRLGLSGTHNRVPKPRFWFGMCNGVAIAALLQPEPFRTVDAITPGGKKVRFLPTDIKALLAASYAWMNDTEDFGGVCETVSLDPGRVCSMNAGDVVLASLNRIGLAHTSFLVDVHPSVQSQNYAVAMARVRLLRSAYPYDGRPTTPRLEGKVQSLADVEVHFDVSSTTLSYETGNHLAAPGDETRFEKVGLHAIGFTWTATLALDASQAIIGGEWTGDPPDGPDTLSFIAGGPSLTDAGTLEVNEGIRWDVVQALARASVDAEAPTPSVDLRPFAAGR
jgi:inner membrane protein